MIVSYTVIQVDSYNSVVSQPSSSVQDGCEVSMSLHQDDSGRPACGLSLPLGSSSSSVHGDNSGYDPDFYLNNFCEYEQGNSEPIVRGRLKSSVPFWRSIGASKFILDIVEYGYKLPFLHSPPVEFLQNNKSSSLHSEFVAEAINDLLSKGLVLESSTAPHVVNPLSVSVNNAGKKRLILDLRFVNKFLWKDRVHFEDWKEALGYFKEGDFMFSFDLKSGYHHVDIYPEHCKYLGFSWNFGDSRGVRYFSFLVLPFGLSTASYIFTKCLRPMVKHWRSKGIFIVVFLDDGWSRSDSFDTCKAIAAEVKKDLLDAGWVPNVEKSQWFPVQSLDWLGMTWNGREGFIKISQRRIDDLTSCIKSFQAGLPIVSARKIASLAGKVNSLSPVMGAITQLMTKFMHHEILRRENWDSTYYISSDNKLFPELFFWQSEVNRINKRVLCEYSIPQTIIFADASQSGGGAWIAECKDMKMVRNWTELESGKSSTWRELKTVCLAIKAFCPYLRGKIVKLFTDNKGVVAIVAKGSMIKQLQDMSLEIFNFCRENQISLQVQWVPRNENEHADELSRLVDFDDWGVSVGFFQFMDGLWGPHTIDRIADDLNCKLHRFNSRFWCPGSEQVDAFASDWAGENNWFVPPIYCIGELLKHVQVCSAKGTLVVPEWPSAPFWPLLFSKHSQFSSLVTHCVRINDSEGVFVQGRNRESIFGSSKFQNAVLCLRLNGF